MKEITKKCSGCGGTGTNPGTVDPENGDPIPTETTCLKCNGSGTLPHSELSDDLIDLLGDMNDKINDILQKVNE